MSETKPGLPIDYEDDELHLTPGQWQDMRFAYDCGGGLDPQPGSIEDRAFNLLDAEVRRDYQQRLASERRDAEYKKWAQAHPEEDARRQAEIEAGWAEPLWDPVDPRTRAACAAADPEPEAEP